MKLNKVILATAAVVLPLSVGAGSALAYFTDRVSSAGGYAVEAGAPQTDITETFGDWTKHVTITNNADSAVPVYVRVRAFSGSQYPVTYHSDDENWKPDGDYYVYDKVLGIGETASGLDIKIEGVPQDASDKDAFNVVVIYERTPVRYDENGTPYADWNYVIKEQKTFPADPESKTPEDNMKLEEGGNES